MLKKIVEKIYIGYDRKTYKKEDDVVFSFLDKFNSKNKIHYLEVGSGLCRFPLLVKDRYKNFDIQCLEKNNDLVNLGIKNGLKVVRGDVTKMDFNNQEFDIIQCSHLIEHLDYKSVTESLDEMLRILKPGGHLIIRSPLMYPGFYFDIDHIRPYPPEAILSYFSNEQQQRVGGYNILEVVRWYRRVPVLFYNTNNYILRIFNLLSTLFWLTIEFPQSRPTGYILILKKV